LLDPLARVGVKAADIDTVEIARTQPADEKLVLVKAGDRWEARSPVTAKLDSFAVDNLVRDLFRAAPVPHPELTANLAVHGLDKPTVRVTLGKGETTATVNVGLTTLGGDRAVTFVTTGQNPGRPLAVRRTELGGLFRDAVRNKDGAAWELARWLPDYRARKPLGADLRDVGVDGLGFKVSGGGKEFALTRSDAGWQFAVPAGWGAADEVGSPEAQASAAPFTGVRPMLTAVTAGTLGVDDYLDKPAGLAEYGLADASPERLRLELSAKAGTPDVIFLGKAVERDGKPVVPTKVYGKFETDPAVFTLPFDRLESVRATLNTPTSLRSRDVLPASAKEATALDLTSGGQTIKLRKVPGEKDGPGRWWLFGGPSGPVEAKPGDVETVLGVLAKPRLAVRVLDAPDDGAVVPNLVRATVKLWAKTTPGKAEPNQPPAEPAAQGEPTMLTLGRVIGAEAVLRRTLDGKTIDFVVPAADVESQVVRSRLGLIDPKVKPFDSDKANRLAIAGPTPVTVVKGATGDWAFDQPDSRKGQSADGPRTLALLATVSNPYLSGVVSEAPTPDELKAMGLEPPQLTATAGLTDGPEKERVVRYGNPKGDGTVYARVGTSPLVVAVRAEQMDALKAADLRDYTVYKLDPAAVVRLSVRGYKGDKGAETYRFEKAADGWTATAPAGFAADPAKVEQLVTALAAPRAEAFVGVGARPEYGLDPAANPEGLEFGLELKDGPARVIVLGAKAGDGLVYASSSGVPGEVFTTKLRAAVDPLAGRPANFQATAPPPPKK
jgi:hypothetical protein